MTTINDKFCEAACEALAAEFDEEFTCVDRENFLGAAGTRIQLIPLSEVGCWMRELATSNSNPPPTADDIHDAIDQARFIQVEFDLDEAGNRFCERYAMINMETGSLI